MYETLAALTLATSRAASILGVGHLVSGICSKLFLPILPGAAPYERWPLLSTEAPAAPFIENEPTGKGCIPRFEAHRSTLICSRERAVSQR